MYDTEASIIRLEAESVVHSTNLITVLHHPMAANFRPKQHTHDYFELMYISNGSCKQKIGEISCDLRTGDLCLLNPFVSHEVDADTEDTDLYNIMIKPSLFKNSFLCMLNGNDLISNFFVQSLFTESTQKSYLYFPREGNMESIRHVHDLIIELMERKPGYQKMAEHYLAMLFLELSRTRQKNIEEEYASTPDTAPLSDVLTYINQNKNDISLTAVAEHFHYHPKYLSSLIKKHTNKSFSEIVQDARLQEACYYLKNTTMSIDEIAQICGYYDRSYFNRLFKKVFHLSPGQFREIS